VSVEADPRRSPSLPQGARTRRAISVSRIPSHCFGSSQLRKAYSQDLLTSPLRMHRDDFSIAGIFFPGKKGRGNMVQSFGTPLQGWLAAGGRGWRPLAARWLDREAPD
jgi:hypothetical protein